MSKKRKLNIALLERYDYISFDIFDTLVQRSTLSNDDVYNITETLYQARYHTEVNNYAETRKRIENALWAETSEGRFTFSNIFSEIEKIYGKEISNRLADIELEVENSLIVRNEKIFEIYQYAVTNKKVIITSDMYLDKFFLEKILNRLGISGYKRIYISGECCACKANGTLFDFITNDIKSLSILHIGDSRKGDYLMPKIKGWNAFKIEKAKHAYFNLQKCSNIEDKLLVGIATTTKYSQEKYWESLGFSILGPLLLAYVSWIKDRVDTNGINKVVFLARDGYIIKKAFDLLYGQDYETRYMYISRKSAIAVTLKETDDLNKVLSRFKFRRKESFKQILCRLGINENALEKLKDFEVKRDEVYGGKYNDLILPFYPEIMRKALEQRQLITEYIQRIFDQKASVIDIGWHGTIQDCIQQVLGEEYQLKGFYLGLENDKGDHKEQFLNTESFDANMIPFTRGVFESFFSAPHASTDGYYKENDEILPVFSSCDMPKQTEESINRIHEGALAFIIEFQKFVAKFELKNCQMDKCLISNMFMKFCNAPRLHDVEYVGKLVFNDTVNRKLIDYHHHKLADNVKAFMQSDWKAGYAKKMFKVELPYGKILAGLNKLRRKD